jgi:hypothetical protein
MDSKRERQKWHLRASDFDKPKLHAKQDWRFLMFFEYLRISPSYLLATQCKDVEELAERLGDREDAARVWQTYCDFGNVFNVLFVTWWARTGIHLFGIKTARPRVASITHLHGAVSVEDLAADGERKLRQYLSSNHVEQGRRDCMVVSIPLGLTRVTALKQLKAILDAAVPMSPPLPASPYELVNNKLQQRRLVRGLRLVYMKAARPKEEMWRAAARAKVSTVHRSLNPLADRKDTKEVEARRIVTIMASRLMHDTHVIAENAARGAFPSMADGATLPYDFIVLGKRLAQMRREEERQKQALPVRGTKKKQSPDKSVM